jgi:VCBS repeat-containing protein
LSSNGSFTYTPSADFAGVDTFTYRVSDTRGGSDTGLVSITVNPVNDAPVAGDDSFGTLEDSGFSLDAPGLLDNDTDVDGDPLSASLSSGPANGTLSLAADGSFTYTPNADFHGADAFVYSVSDGNGGSDSGSVSITVVPANDAPVASDDSYAVDEDQLLSVAAPGVVGNDADVDGDALQSALDVAPLHGDVVLSEDGSFDYTPNPNYSGADLFTYIVGDGNGAADSASVAIVVNAVNDAPSVTGESFTIAEDSTLVVLAPGVLANDSDADGDAITATVSTDAAAGTVTLDSDGGFTYVPNANFNGSDSFTYRVADGNGGESDAPVTITLLPVNDPPAAQDDYYTVAEDDTRNEPAPGVLANDVDVDGDALTVTPTSAPANGSLTLNANGSFVYTPALNFDARGRQRCLLHARGQHPQRAGARSPGERQ